MVPWVTNLKPRMTVAECEKIKNGLRAVLLDIYRSVPVVTVLATSKSDAEELIWEDIGGERYPRVESFDYDESSALNGMLLQFYAPAAVNPRWIQDIGHHFQHMMQVSRLGPKDNYEPLMEGVEHKVNNVLVQHCATTFTYSDRLRIGVRSRGVFHGLPDAREVKLKIDACAKRALHQAQAQGFIGNKALGSDIALDPPVALWPSELDHHLRGYRIIFDMSLGELSLADSTLKQSLCEDIAQIDEVLWLTMEAVKTVSYTHLTLPTKRIV